MKKLFVQTLLVIFWGVFTSVLISCEKQAVLEEKLEVEISQSSLINEANKYFNDFTKRGRVSYTFSKIQVPFDLNWNKAEIFKSGNESIILVPILYSFGDGDIDAKIGVFRSALFTLDKNGKTIGGDIIQVDTDNERSLKVEKAELSKNIYKNELKKFSGTIHFFDLKFNFQKSKRFNGGVCKTIIELSNSYVPKKKNGRTTEQCTDWYMVTTDTSTGQVVGEQYVGTTCEGGTGGGSSGSGSGSYSPRGPYLCPSSFKYTKISSVGNTSGLGSSNVKAGYNNIEISFNIQIAMPNRFHKDYVSHYQLHHFDIMVAGGATLQGDYYYLDEKSMRIMASRASDSAGLLADESLLQFGPIDYLTQFSEAGRSYLMSYGLFDNDGSNSPQFNASPANPILPTNQALQINSLFLYWYNDCYN